MSQHKVYEGNEPYIFVSYSHADWDTVKTIVSGLQDMGFRVWYDTGIVAGSQWIDYIAKHIDNCECVLTLISKTWLNSPYCDQEICYTINRSKKFLPVYLENVNMPSGLQMQFSTIQALFYYRYDSMIAFLSDLCYNPQLARCNTKVSTSHSAFVQKSPEELVNEGLEYEKNKKHSAAMECYQKAAATGYAPAQYYVGRQYLIGGCVYQDSKTAMKWFILAAEQGYARAQWQAATCYEKGDGVIKNPYEAFRWYAKAADQDDIDALYDLGRCFEQGIGTQQDDEEAIAWYENASDRGHQKARERLRALVREGKLNPMDAPPDYEEDDAHELFMKGIQCYSNQNYAGAVDFFKKAARLGNTEARDILKSSNIPW